MIISILEYFYFIKKIIILEQRVYFLCLVQFLVMNFGQLRKRIIQGICKGNITCKQGVREQCQLYPDLDLHGILQSCRVLMLQCYVWDSRRYSCPEFPAIRLSGINPSKKRLSGIIKCTDTWTQSWFSISFHSIIIIIINQHIFTVTVRKTYIY